MHKQSRVNRSIFCHLYYPDKARELLSKLDTIIDTSTYLFLNIHKQCVQESEFEEFARDKEDRIFRINCPDKGRDIGAKLMLIELYLQLGIKSDYSLIIHDKKSPHIANAHRWHEELYRVVEPAYQGKINGIFEKKPNIGIVASAGYIQDEYLSDKKTFLTNNKEHLERLLEKYKISTADYHYVAGNIFWIRTRLLESFFVDRPIWKIREELESGNALDFENGTFVHAWERVMSWISSSQGYEIYGI